MKYWILSYCYGFVSYSEEPPVIRRTKGPLDLLRLESEKISNRQCLYFILCFCSENQWRFTKWTVCVSLMANHKRHLEAYTRTRSWNLFSWSKLIENLTQLSYTISWRLSTQSSQLWPSWNNMLYNSSKLDKQH